MIVCQSNISNKKKQEFLGDGSVLYEQEVVAQDEGKAIDKEESFEQEEVKVVQKSEVIMLKSFKNLNLDGSKYDNPKTKNALVQIKDKKSS